MAIQSNNHTQVPNCIMDEHMRNLTGSALKVLLLICRKTIGWHKDRDRISQSQIMEATGLSKNGVKMAAIELANAGLISFEQTGTGKGIQTFFELNYSGDANGSKTIGSESDTIKRLNGSESDTIDGSNGSKSDPTKEININKKKKKASQAPHADYSRTVELFATTYERLHKAKMSFSAKDGKQIKDLLSNHSYDEIKKKIDIMISRRDTDAWLKQQALTPGLILSQWNKLIAAHAGRQLESFDEYHDKHMR
jgi:phage replication O-like protein O